MLDVGREGTETGPKPAPISRGVAIWERSVKEFRPTGKGQQTLQRGELERYATLIGTLLAEGQA